MESIVAVILFILFVSGVIGVLFYCLEAAGMYAIAKRRQIHHAALAWVPVINVWMLGCISDQYQYVVKGRTRNRRTLMLVLQILSLLLSIGVTVTVSPSLTLILENPNIHPDLLTEMVLGSLMSSFALAAIESIFALILLVFTYIALYDLYRSCNPDGAVLYLVLSLFFSWLEPILVFICRKQDMGMPPLRVNYGQPQAYTIGTSSAQPGWQRNGGEPESGENRGSGDEV